MLVTEAEAKSKTCPHLSRLITYKTNYHGEEATSLCPEFCGGSGCMVWRWYDGNLELKHTDEGKIYGVEIGGEKLAGRRGYCGLAGRPGGGE